MSGYDPFAPGPFEVESRAEEMRDGARDRLFRSQIWKPNKIDRSPLVVFSHRSGASRLAATFLCTHLSSHGYVVAALDHSETFVPELMRPATETAERKAERAAAVIASRVPDIRFLLDTMAGDASVDAAHIGIVGHSFGGWTALAAPEADARVKSVVALAPGGASNPRPGILPGTLTFRWGRDVPTLYLVAENDVMLPLDGMFELFERTQATKQMVILRRADHMHFEDNVEQMHESVRTMPWPAELAWLAKEIRPIAELSSGDAAHTFVRSLTLAHFDATLRGLEDARRLLGGDLEAELTARGVEATVHRP
jgi:predicted dienelactone hydrolase